MDTKVKTTVSFLLAKEIELSQLINNAINEGLRLGLDTDRGNDEIKNLIKSLKFSIDDMEDKLGRM